MSATLPVNHVMVVGVAPALLTATFTGHPEGLKAVLVMAAPGTAFLGCAVKARVQLPAATDVWGVSFAGSSLPVPLKSFDWRTSVTQLYVPVSSHGMRALTVNVYVWFRATFALRISM